VTTARATVAGPFGPLGIVAGGDGLRALLLPPTATATATVTSAWTGAADDPDHPVLRMAARQLGEYFARRRRAFTVALAPAGTPFQLAVWTALRAIPFGETISYRELAARAGRPEAIRAAGAANAANPLAIVIPCHRVIGSDGSLTGYAGGLAAKRALLALEGARAGTPRRQQRRPDLRLPGDGVTQPVAQLAQG
jgi:methylated-DNA-[protein]-cysteine S-methyltransferase